MTKARINKLEYITETYHEYKKEKDKFVEYLNEKIERENKDRAGNDIPDDKQQKVSKSKWCDWAWISRGKKKRNSKKKEENDNENIWTVIKGTI